MVRFCFQYVTLEEDLRRYACDVDMMDSALERPDVTLSKRGTAGTIVLKRAPLRALQSFFLTPNPTKRGIVIQKLTTAVIRELLTF